MGEKGVDVIPGPIVPQGGGALPWGDPVPGGPGGGGGGLAPKSGTFDTPMMPAGAPGGGPAPAPAPPAPAPIDAVALHQQADTFSQQINDGTYPGTRAQAIA